MPLGASAFFTATAGTQTAEEAYRKACFTTRIECVGKRPASGTAQEQVASGKSFSLWLTTLKKSGGDCQGKPLVKITDYKDRNEICPRCFSSQFDY
jgi:hypothetical protein